MTSEIPFWWRVSIQIWVVLLIGGEFASSNQKHYPDLEGDTSSLWNFCACFSDVISRVNKWGRSEMLAIFSAYIQRGSFAMRHCPSPGCSYFLPQQISLGTYQVTTINRLLFISVFYRKFEVKSFYQLFWTFPSYHIIREIAGSFAVSLRYTIRTFTSLHFEIDATERTKLADLSMHEGYCISKAELTKHHFGRSSLRLKRFYKKVR